MLRLVAIGLLLAACAVGLWLFSRGRAKLWRISARVASVTLASISALVVALVLFGSALCGRYDFPAVLSPDRLVAARVSEYDCGAMDSFHSSVHLWRNNKNFLSSLLKARWHSTAVFTVGHDPRLLELQWKAARELVIRYPNDSRSPEEFHCQSRWNDVRIECIAYTPQYPKMPANLPPPVTDWSW